MLICKRVLCKYQSACYLQRQVVGGQSFQTKNASLLSSSKTQCPHPYDDNNH